MIAILTNLGQLTSDIGVYMACEVMIFIEKTQIKKKNFFNFI